jgi:hypothetical protein
VYVSRSSSEDDLSSEGEAPATTTGDDNILDEEDEDEDEEEDSDDLDEPLDSLDRAFADDLAEFEEDNDYADSEEESVNAMVALPPLSDCE